MVRNNRFKTYDNKSSLKKKKSRQLKGGYTEEFTNRLGWWERYNLSPDQTDDVVVTLTSVYNKRPDLLSFDFYKSNHYDWIILQYNSIVDIDEEFVTGATIVLPSYQKVSIDIMSNEVRELDV
jgi:hypothetical protein